MPLPQQDFQLRNGALTFLHGSASLPTTCVRGTIMNSVVDTRNTERLRDWKRTVAKKVKSARRARCCPKDFYAITIDFRFHPANHGYRRQLDVDNFVNPSLTRWQRDSSAASPKTLANGANGTSMTRTSERV